MSKNLRNVNLTNPTLGTQGSVAGVMTFLSGDDALGSVTVTIDTTGPTFSEWKFPVAGIGEGEVVGTGVSQVLSNKDLDNPGFLNVPTATVAADDKVLVLDTGSSDATKTVTAQSIADLASGGTPRFHFSTLFEDIARFNSVVAGSGTNTFGIYGNAQTSSATINNAATVAALVGINDTDNSIYVRNPSVTFGCEVTNAASGGGQIILLGGVVTFNGSGFSGTGRDWFGFRVVYTAGTPVLYATNGNNGTETQTDVTSGITLTNFNEFSAVMTTGTDIKFYINGTLVATHTTNLPTATDDSAYFQTGVSNTGTADEVAIRVGYADYSRDIL